MTLPSEATWPAERSPRAPQLRERATWLGVGTLIGVTLAASMLPDPPSGLEPPPAVSEVPAARAGVALMASAGAPASSLVPRIPEPSAKAAPTARTSVAPMPASPRPAARAPSSVPASSVRAPVAVAAATVSPRRPALKPAAPAVADVLREVRRYESALTRMDASATQDAWPAVDRDALVRQFSSLREQQLRLEGCAVDTPGNTAAVTCRGTLKYRPRVGDHSTRTTRGTWRFALERDAGRWVIEDVAAPPDGPRP